MLLLAAGLVLFIGTVVGIFGGGGSILMVPLLLYVMHVEPRVAIPTSQVILAVTSLAALIAHAAAGRVIWSVGAAFGGAGMLGAFAGGLIAHLIPSRVLLICFALLMLASALAMFRNRAEPAASVSGMKQSALVRCLLLGIGTGLIAGLLGAGGGFLIVPALSLFAGLPIGHAIATSLLVISLQSIAGAAGHLSTARIDWQQTAVLAACMSMGSVAGSLIAPRVPAEHLRRLFAGLILLVALFMLLRNW